MPVIRTVGIRGAGSPQAVAPAQCCVRAGGPGGSGGSLTAGEQRHAAVSSMGVNPNRSRGHRPATGRSCLASPASFRRCAPAPATTAAPYRWMLKRPVGLVLLHCPRQALASARSRGSKPSPCRILMPYLPVPDSVIPRKPSSSTKGETVRSDLQHVWCEDPRGHQTAGAGRLGAGRHQRKSQAVQASPAAWARYGCW